MNLHHRKFGRRKKVLHSTMDATLKVLAIAKRFAGKAHADVIVIAATLGLLGCQDYTDTTRKAEISPAVEVQSVCADNGQTGESGLSDKFIEMKRERDKRIARRGAEILQQERIAREENGVRLVSAIEPENAQPDVDSENITFSEAAGAIDSEITEDEKGIEIVSISVSEDAAVQQNAVQEDETQTKRALSAPEVPVLVVEKDGVDGSQRSNIERVPAEEQKKYSDVADSYLTEVRISPSEKIDEIEPDELPSSLKSISRVHRAEILTARGPAKKSQVVRAPEVEPEIIDSLKPELQSFDGSEDTTNIVWGQSKASEDIQNTEEIVKAENTVNVENIKSENIEKEIAEAEDKGAKRSVFSFIKNKLSFRKSAEGNNKNESIAETKESIDAKVASNVKGAEGGEDADPDTVASEEVRKLSVVKQMKSVEARRMLEKGRKLYDSQEYAAALKLFKEAEALDPENMEIRKAISMTSDLVESSGVDPEAQLAEKVVRQAIAREKYSAVQLRSMLDKAEKVHAEVASEKSADPKVLSHSRAEISRALELVSKVDIMLQGDVAGGISKADYQKRARTIRGMLLAERSRINGILEDLSREETMKAARNNAKSVDETLQQQIEEMMKSAKYYLERKEFAKVMEISAEVMRMDPNYSGAKELHDRAQNMEHETRREQSKVALQKAEDDWILDVEEMAIPVTDTVTYPSDWETIKRRAQRASSVNNLEGWKLAIKEKLETQRISMDFDNLPLKNVMDYIQETAQINIVMDKTVEPSKPVKLSVNGMRLGKVLDWVLRLTNYHMDMRNEAIYISSEPKSDIFMRLYPVYDLTHPAVDYDGPRINTAMGDDDDDEDIGGLFGDDDDDDDEFGEGGEEESLIDNIKSHIAPQSWEDETGRISINMYQDNILVMQSASVHAQIGDYLKKLRETRKQQILVNTRILSITDNFLEQIGVTWGDSDPSATNSSTAAGTSGDPQNVASGIGVTDFSQDNRSTDHRNYAFGVSVIPGLGAADTNTAANGGNGGLSLDLRYLSRTILNDFEVNATVEAVVQNRKGSVLHNPQLLVANGRNAYVEVNTKTNYISGWEITNNAFEPEIDIYRQGVVYDVKPVISFDKKYVTIRMRPALSSLVSNIPRIIQGTIIAGDTDPVVIRQNLSIGMPQLSLTRLWTYVTVPNGGSVMMGGYIQDDKQEASSGVPMLSSLPFLGRLTKSNSKERDKRNLIFITGAKIVELD